MSTYVLVHGAWVGSWCWKRVRRALQALGHEVFTPTLTGLADRSHLLSPQINLDTHITDIVNLIQWEGLSRVVLCGHSYGGCVVTGVADRVPERIDALVYLDAFVPENGQSLHDIVPSEARNAQVQGARELGDGWRVPPIPAETFHVNGGDLDWVNRQYTMQPLAAAQQPIRLSGGIAQIKNITFVLANGWSPPRFQRFYERAKAKDWRTVTMSCGHFVMLDLPNELTHELLAASPSSALPAP